MRFVYFVFYINKYFSKFAQNIIIMESTIKKQREESIRSDYFELLKDMKSVCPMITTEDVIVAMMDRKAPRFFTSLPTAQRIISRMFRGYNVAFSNKNKERMYNEIFSRTIRALREGSIKSYADIETIIEQPAPSYYVNLVTMKTIVYKSLKQNH